MDQRDMNTALCDFAMSDRQQIWKLPFDELSKPEQVFLLIWELESEVNNGGFHQYFFNDAGGSAIEASEALRQIGANKMASILAKAVKLFPNDCPPADRSARQSALEVLIEDDAWEAIDDAFIDYPDDLTRLLYDYCQNHAGDIRGFA